MRCPSCRAEVPAGKFCAACGEALPPACPACGTSYPASAKFCPECGHKLAATGQPLPTWPAPTRSPEAERRQLTVMFVDLVGSTALSTRLDPEEMGEVLRAYQHAVAGEVLRFAGHVAKYMGDGVLAYFGWPQAHEDAAERAVRAGLAIVEAVGRLKAPDGQPLAARVGVATGLVVVGELVGNAEARERAVVGETPNLAARLQAVADPGTVVVGEATRRLLGDMFAFTDIGTQSAKGFAEPVRAFRVVGESTAESRFDARYGARLASFVGRNEELALLLRRWRRAKEGAGQVVLLCGEPGIGKSRLTRALRERLKAEAHTALSYQCSPHHTHSALYPVIDQLERAARFEREDTAEAKLIKLEAVLAEDVVDVAAVAPLIATLLAIPAGDRYPPLDLAPQRQKELTLRALLEQLEGLAAEEAVFAVYEDVHWIDPTTSEFLDLLVERVQHLPVLLLVTFRPEFKPPWTGHAHVTSLTLTRLDRPEAAALVERVTGGKRLPEPVLREILAKTDGVPLFVEELTKAVLESGLLRDEGDRYAPSGPSSPLAIPATLHDSLLARLDRLAPVKEVAQIGAALGREFSYELLAVVVPLPEERLQDALDQLCASELVFCRGAPPEASYSFKHALVQDAAYSTLLKSKRRQIHARIAAALEERFPEAAELEPELLAHHCTEAGLAEKAIEYWYRAGRRAMAQSAMVEAVAQLTQALVLLAGLPAGPDRDRQELDLQVALGNAFVATRGWAAPEVGQAYARARELCTSEAHCTEEARTPQLLAALSGLVVYHQHSSSVIAARGIAEELLRLAERQRDTAAQVVGHRRLGESLLFNGRPLPALARFERALALYTPADHTSLVFLGSTETRAACPSYAALALQFQGYPDRALARSREGLAAAHAAGHAHTLSHVLFLTCWLHQVRGEPRLVRERAGTMMTLTAEHGFAGWLADATSMHGWALAADGEVTAGLARMRDGLAAYQATGVRLQVPYYLGLLAGIHARAENPIEALSVLAKALALVDRIEERWFEAELHRLKGEALLALPPERSVEAEACYRQALAVARDQGTHLWELRAATSLARLWRDEGRRAEARELLAPVYGWFTEGFDTADLRDAKALLDELHCEGARLVAGSST